MSQAYDRREAMMYSRFPSIIHQHEDVISAKLVFINDCGVVGITAR